MDVYGRVGPCRACQGVVRLRFVKFTFMVGSGLAGLAKAREESCPFGAWRRLAWPG